MIITKIEIGYSLWFALYTALSFLFKVYRGIIRCNQSLPRLILELANSEESSESSSSKNQEVVLALYDALKSRNVGTVNKILASDLEWWFHGPPSHQFLMRLLTGAEEESNSCFEFVPFNITSFGPLVISEGCDNSRSISWVHAWTVTDGVITQVREYFNTSLTVTRLGNEAQPSDCRSKPKLASTSEITSLRCPSVWESSFSNLDGKSVPGLVLAI
ncbi:hypothetical protein K2173_005051 [Erythroxylum novogranatense]|uniref:Wound-induced protein 1 n=1 Tax=Erythroxylum novogranatense TaxID=1862640 RepID=A0AAV8TBD4_9ROSI|nr:hypothetical protein K2173_005051 [Erythroxylum novogranatense]